MALSDLNPIEQKIIGKLFDQLDAADKESLLLVDLFSGDDEPDVSGAWVRSLYEEGIGASDETILKIMNREGVSVSILLIHGNGEDLISDYSWSREGDSERFMQELLEGMDEAVEDEIEFISRIAAIELVTDENPELLDPSEMDEYLTDEGRAHLHHIFKKYHQMVLDARKIVEANT